MELELPAMFAYISFPEEWFTEVGLFHDQVKALDTITLAVDESVFAVDSGRDCCQKDDHRHQQDPE